MITIGQLARYAGVTTKAVRVYHGHALMSEPARDSSGYRRYRAEDAIRLVKIRTLARAGVPLGIRTTYSGQKNNRTSTLQFLYIT
jgi:DNA-binding transcriptional MerR regulator